jgi:tRNA threonylcarbamoyladenosine biosynthesis protein TsaE
MTLPLTINTVSVAETERFGVETAKKILDDSSLPRFIALYGDLGVGKTAFVRGFTSALAPAARVKSPTFALVNEYKGSPLSVFHFDMYRITDEDDLYSIGFYDYRDRGGVILVEWSENIPYALPEEYISITIEKDSDTDEDSRRITVKLITDTEDSHLC